MIPSPLQPPDSGYFHQTIFQAKPAGSFIVSLLVSGVGFILVPVFILMFVTRRPADVLLLGGGPLGVGLAFGLWGGLLWWRYRAPPVVLTGRVEQKQFDAGERGMAGGESTPTWSISVHDDEYEVPKQAFDQLSVGDIVTLGFSDDSYTPHIESIGREIRINKSDDI